MQWSDELAPSLRSARIPIDVKELRYFRAVAEFGSFSKAAAHLRVAQPALSRQIQKLEHSLGVEVLRRTSRGVATTAAGVTLLEHAIRLERNLQEAHREVHAHSNAVGGSVRMAVQYPLSLLLLPPIIHQYTRAFPEVALHVIEAFSGEIIDALLSRRFDLAVVDPPSHPHPELTSFPLWSETLGLVGPAKGLVSEKLHGPVDIETLAGLPMIMNSAAASTVRQLVDTAFARRHMRLKPVMECDGALMLAELIRSGMGYTVFPISAFSHLENSAELKTWEIKPSIRRTVSIVVRSEILEERMVAPLITMIKSFAPKLVGMESYPAVAFYHGEGLEELAEMEI